MSLKSYKEKRTFEETPEPEAKKSVLPKKNKFPAFCIQKHAASHLHYDFRLEHKGVLLSWAVPKGPSLDPSLKRLAIQVEDHPFEYRNFEGVIPPHNYGAGAVMLWDKGIYTVSEATTKKEVEKKIADGLSKGRLEIQLLGEKLKGTFVLIKLKKEDTSKAEWLLFKKQDEHSTTKEDVLQKDFSVKTGRSMEEIFEGVKKKPKNSVKAPFGFIKPMLATLIKEPFDNKEWLFEIKWDGYRALAYREGSGVEIFSRNKNSFNHLFPLIVKELSTVKEQMVLDGEIVVVDSTGKSFFQLMQNYQNGRKEGQLCYYVFDILAYEGEDLRDLPLIERKTILQKILKKYPFRCIHYSDHIEEKGKSFFQEAVKNKLEGIVAKKKQSLYSSTRGLEWLKIKSIQRQEVVIGGFTKGREGREYFGSLLIGVYDEKGKLLSVGHVGGGFNKNLLKEVYEKMKPLIQEKCPFSEIPKTNTEPTWLKPKLVCEITFSEWTKEGKARIPIFKGLRIDKKPKEVKREISKESLP